MIPCLDANKYMYEGKSLEIKKGNGLYLMSCSVVHLNSSFSHIIGHLPVCFQKIMPVLGNLLWGRWALLKMTDALASKC